MHVVSLGYKTLLIGLIFFPFIGNAAVISSFLEENASLSDNLGVPFPTNYPYARFDFTQEITFKSFTLGWYDPFTACSRSIEIRDTNTDVLYTFGQVNDCQSVIGNEFSTWGTSTDITLSPGTYYFGIGNNNFSGETIRGNTSGLDSQGSIGSASANSSNYGENLVLREILYAFCDIESSCPLSEFSGIGVVEPSNGSTTASTTINIEVHYENQDLLGDRVTVNIFNENLFTTLVSTTDYDVTSSPSGTIYDELTLGSGKYKIEAILRNVSSSSEITRSDFNSFVVVEDSLPEIIGFDPSDYESVIGLATTTCSITNLAGCFQNALVFAFYPSPEVLENFKSLEEDFKSKIPVAYFYIFQDLINSYELSTSTAPNLTVDLGSDDFQLGTLEVMNLNNVDNNFDFTNIVEWLEIALYILLGLYIANRVYSVAVSV